MSRVYVGIGSEMVLRLLCSLKQKNELFVS